MPNDSGADQSEQVAGLYAELLQLFEEAQQLQIHSAHLVAIARLACADISANPASTEPHPPADTTTHLSAEETLDRIITLLAECPFETQVNIMSALARAMASVAHARADVKQPPTA